MNDYMRNYMDNYTEFATPHSACQRIICLNVNTNYHEWPTNYHE